MHAENKMKKWKILFGVVAFLVVLEFITFPFKENIGVYDFIGLIFSGFSLIPLYGYAYSIAIGNQIIAIIIFCLNAIAVAIISVLAVIIFLNNITIIQFIFSILGLSLAILFIFPQFMYAFKSSKLWLSNA